jgi:hypothetical protein
VPFTKASPHGAILQAATGPYGQLVTSIFLTANAKFPVRLIGEFARLAGKLAIWRGKSPKK